MGEHYPFVKAVAKIHTNGVPISFSKELVCGPTCQQRFGHVDAAPLELTFNDWAAGAGEIETIPCAESSSTDLSAHPEAMHSVALLNALMQQLSQIPEMESLMSKLPSMSPLFEQQLQLAGHSANGKIVWRSWALALSGGVVGGVFVLVLAKAYRRMNFRSEPLLVDALGIYNIYLGMARTQPLWSSNDRPSVTCSTALDFFEMRCSWV